VRITGKDPWTNIGELRDRRVRQARVAQALKRRKEARTKGRNEAKARRHASMEQELKEKTGRTGRWNGIMTHKRSRNVRSVCTMYFKASVLPYVS
jgi:hypothetical protein